MTLLKGQGVTPPAEVETTASCSDGCTTILEAGPAVRGAAVISSYAKPLLEGCGTVKKGDLRVVGETAPVPFITAFVNAQLPASDREAITEALLAAGRDPKLAVALETKVGFVPAVKKN
jgi:ABC-type phosphate/phosphonate transport system substrate-binding protein